MQSMATKLRPPGGLKPVGTKLARPVGGLRPPSGSGLRKSSESPGNNTRPSSQPPPGVRKPGHQGQTKSVAKSLSPAVVPQPASNGTVEALEIGDRVLVNGKAGELAFIGSTQFAKGTWAGIILDSKDGKNNGSVNGVQYFQCEPSRGLFAKAEKVKFVSRGGSHGSAPPPEQGQTTKPSVSAATATTNLQEQFQVGDRVTVDNQKEGVIGFLGATQFAKGVWVGVILDSPEGKNNGSVNGVQYFDCEANYGLFTRPNKLDLVSKANAAASSTTNTTTDSTSSLDPPSSKTPVQQAEGMQRSAQLTPVDLKALRDKLNIGDQVLVSGVKEGILRFLGPTEFAKGIWVGVELPEPMGKNDGAISGKRFVCLFN